MSLPKLNEIKYEIELPVSKKKITVRPWLVKEEKALMIAKESGKPNEVADAIVNILKACSYGEDVEKLPMVDIEYMLLMVKSYSAGEMTTVNIRCNHSKEGVRCGHISEVDVDLHKEISMTADEMPNPEIALTDTISIHMRPPKFEAFRTLLKDQTVTEMSFETMASSIEYVINDGEIIRDFTAQEISEFFEGFTKKQLDSVKKYISGLPKLQVKHTFKCPNCGTVDDFVLENLFNFFTD